MDSQMVHVVRATLVLCSNKPCLLVCPPGLANCRLHDAGVGAQSASGRGSIGGGLERTRSGHRAIIEQAESSCASIGNWQPTVRFGTCSPLSNRHDVDVGWLVPVLAAWVCWNLLWRFGVLEGRDGPGGPSFITPTQRFGGTITLRTQKTPPAPDAASEGLSRKSSRSPGLLADIFDENERYKPLFVHDIRRHGPPCHSLPTANPNPGRSK